MELHVKMYEELTADELYEILKLRASVFVVDQNCAYLDVDGRDKKACHVFYTDEKGIKSYLRVLDKGVFFNEVCIGRVISVKRRCGYGTMVLKEGIKAAKEKFGAEKVAVEAQTYARGLYEKLGFRQVSEEFLDEGIPHVKMELDL